MKPTKKFVTDKLKELNGSLLKKPYASRWKPDNPTFGYCYVVSEALYHYLPGKVTSHSINMGKDLGVHWYVKVDNQIVDFTAEQFNFQVDYSQGVGRGFMKGGIKTERGYISKRGYEIAQLLKLI